MQVESLVELLQWRGAEDMASPAFVYLVNGEKPGSVLSYAELDARAKQIAVELQGREESGSRVVVLYPRRTRTTPRPSR